MADIPPAAREQLDCGRVVQIDIVAIRKNEFDIAQRIQGARPLANPQLPSLHGVEACLRQYGDDKAIAPDKLQALLRKISRVAQQPWHRFGRGN